MTHHHQVSMCLKDLTENQLLLLGGALGLYWPNLKKMKLLCQELVEAWLNGADNVLATSGQPTWKSLIKALEEIGQKGTADKISKCEYKLLPNDTVMTAAVSCFSTAGYYFI